MSFHFSRNIYLGSIDTPPVKFNNPGSVFLEVEGLVRHKGLVCISKSNVADYYLGRPSAPLNLIK